MSLEGVNPDIIKFQPIADALRANQSEVAKALIVKLSGAEKLKVKQFIIEDKQKFLKEQKEREARVKQLESEISIGEEKVSRLGTQLAALDIKKAVVFSQGSKQAVVASKARALPAVPSQPSSSSKAVVKI